MYKSNNNDKFTRLFSLCLAISATSRQLYALDRTKCSGERGQQLQSTPTTRLLTSLSHHSFKIINFFQLLIKSVHH